MKKNRVILFSLFVAVFFAPCYVQAQETEFFRQEGIASWYGKEFEGRPTASGEIFDASQLTAAHPSLPFGTVLVVTNMHNDKKVTVRVNDRGPFVQARVIDVSRAAAEHLDMVGTGTAPVLIESVNRIAVPKPNNSGTTNLVRTTPGYASEISQTPAAAVFPTMPADVPPPVQNRIKLVPEISILPGRLYRFQVGSYAVPRNAIDAFEKLKNAGLSPAYERHAEPEKGEFFRVVLAGVQGTDVQLVVEKLMEAGFKEALVREER